MASRELSSKVYININGKDELWYEVSSTGAITWYLPKDITYKAHILKNVGKAMS